MKTDYAMIVITRNSAVTYYYKTWKQAVEEFLAYTNHLNTFETTEEETILVTNQENIRITWKCK